MNPPLERQFKDADALVDRLIEMVGPELVVGVPIGIGKATNVVDALYRRAEADSSLRLSIFSGLTLEPPQARSEIERRFLQPLVERLYGQWPVPLYADALRRRNLPDNITVREFYLRPGAYLGNPLVQQSYTSINYSQVVAELVRTGVNVIAQLVSRRPESPGLLSLGSNPEITLDLLPRMRNESRRPVAMVGEVNRRMPYMLGDAEIDESETDLLLCSDESDFPLFPLPSRRVEAADYATAMHVASLVRDGGTLQVGIGSLSDAVAHCLMLRDRHPEVFARVLKELPGGSTSPRRVVAAETGSFETGLFASTELLSDALFALFESGVVRRPAGSSDESTMHVGFFIGSSDLYKGLRDLPEERRRLINMTRISDVNTLFGEEARKRSQRHDACFVNETMIATLLGAAVSDGLDDGRVVSGVGGQFDFVQMAHQLDDARSILMVRARREAGGRATSNIRYSYGHTTVPRHYRDFYVSEYGIADTRGRTDREVIEAMLGIAGAEFHDELIREAKSAAKLPAGWQKPADFAANTPARISEVIRSPEFREHFPAYPLGTELTGTEQRLARALLWLQGLAARPWSNIATLARAAGGGAGDKAALARMDLEAPTGIRERIMARIIDYALTRTRE